jgi:hypothetical protein
MLPKLAYASPFARIALANIVREYPNNPAHLLHGDQDLRPPRALHPVFYGSYDWHSAVHMHWLLARLLRCCADLPERQQIIAIFDTHFAPANVAAELAYLHGRRAFERPYGWAWLLKLQTELGLLAAQMPQAQQWQSALQALADLIVERYLSFLPLAHYPVRSGTHGNSAFGLLFALDYAQMQQHQALRKLIGEKANTWFGRDRRYPAAYEPGGEDFLSPGMMEAALMLRVLDGCDFADWWEVFRPAPDALPAWLTPVKLSDRSDARLSHLDGLNLSRAWCWKMLAPQLPPVHQTAAHAAIDAHLAASLPHAGAGDYVGTHWLASFALLALTQE